ncbi:ADP-ribosylation factor GTPase-activating protein 2 [Folsomia candida]|uniref:ADP-ribosylation factor GTPase-activating protein 3 n=1 Tax=Folsomia candida TaxID=158441 RepID=A0A226ESN1_FOLCA|nr:ADP-ribosylation factor GTPase-activating protein 2 [Folsomia candida]OXA60645.1 ADP-ribosylation factor GTPase-activating protein 3 [Folsomia candida]
MADEGPNNSAEIQEIFRKLKTNSANRVCFDCNASNPTWASVTYGVFICIDCSAVHRSLGVHVSFVRSIQLDTNWTRNQLRCMQLGGNANAQAFFAQHNCTSVDAQQKYHSRAAVLYKEKLSQQVSKHNRLHGNQIVFEEKSHASHTEKEADFFDEIHKVAQKTENLAIDNGMRLFEPKSSNNQAGDGPSVDGILSGSTPGSSAPRKSTIGQRKPGNKLGAKKGGLGAQKVKADFAEIEKEAEMMDQMKERAVEQAKLDKERQAEQDERQRITMSLAYQDLSKQQTKRANNLRTMDPKKADQVERLGMGFGMRSGISHSMMSDMQTIDQQAPSSSTRGNSNSNTTSSGLSSTRSAFDSGDSFFDDYEVVDEATTHNVTGLEGLTTAPKRNDDWDFNRQSTAKKYSEEDSHYTTRSKPRESANTSSLVAGDEAQKKFGKAKAISSDQFFSGGDDNDYERRTNLSRFEGSTSISSADYFGDGRQRNEAAGSYSNMQNVDLDDVKESVRQGVTKVAGKISNLANGVMSSLQEKYGY